MAQHLAPDCCLACGSSECLTHCAWCWVECGPSPVIHLPYCPQTTGLWPASPDMHCTECALPVGEVYVARITEDETVAHALCLPCASKAS